ncbi:hypothetical protein CLOM_g14433 [Closterium sp. NIES-68]|nr:hypothetical protein CLOM_g14433 [Closterium sp. NIES-68]GJP60704.1 hypothetical protein CLOP_g17916 [Closterium sp. NIES-67]
MCQHTENSMEAGSPFALISHIDGLDSHIACSCSPSSSSSSSSCSFSRRQCKCDDCIADSAACGGCGSVESSPSGSPSCCSTSSRATTHASTSPCISLGDIEQRGRLYSATSGIHLPEPTTPLLPAPLLFFDAGTLLPPVLTRGSFTTASASATDSAGSASAVSSPPARGCGARGSCRMMSDGESSSGCCSNGIVVSSDGRDSGAVAACRATSFRRIVGFCIKEDGCGCSRNGGHIEAPTDWEGGHPTRDARGSTGGHYGNDTFSGRNERAEDARLTAPRESAPTAEARLAEEPALAEQVPRERRRAVSARDAGEQVKAERLKAKGELTPQHEQIRQQARAEQRGGTGEATPARRCVSEEGGGRKAREESCLSGRHGDGALRRDAKRTSRMRH